MSTPPPNQARVIPLRPPNVPTPAPREVLWRDLIGGVLRRERLSQERTLKDVADEARISVPYLSELERGRKEASSEVLAAAARALGLGLADVLSLAQHELARPVRSTVSRSSVAGGSVAGRPATRGRTSPSAQARYDGLRLAA